MTGLCHPFSALLPTVLLLLLATDFTGAHPPMHMPREGSRVRRSATSPNEDAPHNVAHPSEPLDSSEKASVTQRPATSADVIVTRGSPSTEHPSDTKDLPTTPAHMQPHPASTHHMKASARPQRDTTENITTGDASNILNPAATTSPVPGASHTSDAAKASSDSSRSPEMSQPSTSTIKPTLPHSESSPSNKSLLSPVTSSVQTNASTTTANISTAGHTTVPRVSGDPTSNATTPAAGLQPQPHPKVTEVITTATTTSNPPPLTPRRGDCPVFTQSPGQKHTLVSHCLIAIASLAGLATLFMACSIVLCTKLSAARQRYRYHMRSGGEGTEMVCISALMPDGDAPPIRHKIPKSNGALIPITDADSDGGDNLTLNSFLPDGDRL